MTKRPGLIVVISSPSGGGKTTVVERLLKRHPDWVRSVSVTTRAPREGERRGEDYLFLTEEAFKRMQKEGSFLESAKVIGHHYGTPRAFVLEQYKEGRCVILTLDIQGMQSVKKVLDSKVRLLTLFLLPPSLKVLRERLEGRRTETPELIEKRLNAAAEEIRMAGRYDDSIMNQNLEQTVLEIEKIIRKRLRAPGLSLASK